MSVIQGPLKERMKTIAKKYGIHPSKVEELENTMWDFVRKEMAKGEKNKVESFETIYLRFLGTFCVMEGKIKHLKEHDKQA